jgi:hypothetical protein
MSPLACFAEAAGAPANSRGDLAGVTYSVAGLGNEREGERAWRASTTTS